MTLFRKLALSLTLFGLTAPVSAQVREQWLVSGGAGNFFVCVIAGILLAFAFHFLLTNLAIAMGISSVHDLRDTGKGKHSTASPASSSGSDDSDATPMGVKVTSGLGLAMTLAMSISLFFASLLAVRLSLIPDNFVGIALGLVIWAGYLLIGMCIEVKMFSSLTGSLMSLISSAFGSGASALSHLAAPSQKSQIQHATHDALQAIHEEVRQEFDISGFQKKLEEYLDRMEPQHYDLDNIENHLVHLLREVEIKEEFTPDDPDATKRLFLEVAGKSNKKLSNHDKERLSKAFDKAKATLQTEGSREDKAMAGLGQLAPGGEEQAREYLSKIEQYLRDTHRDELNPDNLKKDLERILHDPKAAPEVVSSRASKIDRTTLKALLTSREGIDEAKADQYLDRAEEVLAKIRSRAQSKAASAETGSASMQDRSAAARSQGQGTLEEKRAGAERAIAQWFDRTHRPEVQYDRLKSDAKHMLDDPQAAPAVLRNRLRRMDRDTLITLLSNNRRISREQAERAVSHIEEARDEIILKTEEMERQVKHKLEAAKREALAQAEATRKTAASAAWWMFFAAVVSAAASSLGGMLAITL